MIPLRRLSSSSSKKYLLLFLILFALIFVRYCCYGFEYYHQLDDYIQYHNYAKCENPFAFILNKGLLAARPLAGVSDIFIWSHFFENMIIAAAILSAMYAVSALLLKWVWARHFQVGYVFLTVFSLLPLGIEGTYWVSASSRIIPGLFFSSLALFFFTRWCFSGRRLQLPLFVLFQLICFGFYEQALIFSVASVLIVSALFFIKHRNRRSLWGLLSFAGVAVYLLFTYFFRGSAVYGNRLGIITTYGYYYWGVNFPYVIKQVFNAFIKGGFYTLYNGTRRGAQMIVSDGLFLYTVAVSFLCTVLFFFIKRGDGHSSRDFEKPVFALLAGILLTIAPISIFFVINNAWFSLRCTVMSFCGIALIADTFALRIFAKLKHGRTVTALAVSCFALICCIASVSEMRDYRDTNAFDKSFVKILAQRLESDKRLDSELKIAVVNVLPSYLASRNFFHHEHIHGVTESGWALTGALESYVGTNRPSITPIPKDPAYQPWNIEDMRIDNFDTLYLYLDGTLRDVHAEKTAGDTYTLFDKDKPVAYIREENNYGYLHLIPSDAP